MKPAYSVEKMVHSINNKLGIRFYWTKGDTSEGMTGTEKLAGATQGKIVADESKVDEEKKKIKFIRAREKGEEK